MFPSRRKFVFEHGMKKWFDNSGQARCVLCWNEDLPSFRLFTRCRGKSIPIIHCLNEPLDFLECKALRVQDTTICLMRFHRSIVHIPDSKGEWRKPSLDLGRNDFSSLPIKLMSKETKRWMAQGLETILCVGFSENHALPDSRRRSQPRSEFLCQPVNVGTLDDCVFDFQTKGLSFVLRLEATITEQCADNNLSLATREFE